MMRPPPLQLQIDNRYPSRVRSHREKAGFFIAALYCTSWRNAVLAVSGINALRFTLSALNAYHDIDIDNSLLFPHLAGVSSFLCGTYLVVGLIDIFGILSISVQRVIFIRIYSCLAILSAPVVTVAGAVVALTFYIFGDDVIQECTVLAMGGNLMSKSVFRGRPWPLSQRSMGGVEAARACRMAWTSEGPSQIVSVFVFSLLPSIIYCLLVYTYYRQVVDPTHPGYLKEGYPHSSIGMVAWPSDSPMYNDSGRKGRTGRKKRAPATMNSSSPLMGYLLTPGPPSFGPARTQGYDPNRVELALREGT